MNITDINKSRLAVQEIGVRLRARRLQMNVTQAALATHAGVGLNAIKRLESGKGASLDTFMRILAALGWGDNMLNALLEPQPTAWEIVQAAQSPTSSYAKSLKRVRASGATRLKQQADGRKPWQWGDETGY